VSWGRPLTPGKKQVKALGGTVVVGDQASVSLPLETASGGVGFDYMNTTEFCASAGLTPRDLQFWLEIGLLVPADMVRKTAIGGLRREFTSDEAERTPDGRL
jgi:hypothetical protein